MPKTKTNKTLSKRIRVTKRGKVLARRRTTQHLVARASKRAVKHSGQIIAISESMAKGIKKLLPYS